MRPAPFVEGIFELFPWKIEPIPYYSENSVSFTQGGKKVPLSRRSFYPGDFCSENGFFDVYVDYGGCGAVRGDALLP